MSALAKIASEAGFAVTGSDLKTGGHKADNISKDLDLVIYNSAITKGSPGEVELIRAKELGLKTVSRGEYLARLVNKAKRSVVVSGMHGKTTITTLIGLVLKNNGNKPTVIPGTYVAEFGANYLLGSKDLIVTEGCEYHDNFLHLRPKIAVISNIEQEHLDYFGDLKTIIKSFAKFIENIDPDGCLVYFAGDENIRAALRLASKRPKTLVGYGQGGNVLYQKLGYKLKYPGAHNKLNALAVEAVADYLEVSRNITKKSLQSYQGAGRRLEIKGEKKGILVIDDYGHHPTEIKNTILALKEAYPGRRLVTAFWPHQYKRIESLFSDFAEALSLADEVLLLPIYLVPGRDEERPVSSKQLADEIQKKGTRAKSFPDQSSMVKYLNDTMAANSLLLTVGIPPINQVAEEFLEGER